MFTFKQFILEKRKNPEQNPKISIYAALEPYKDDPNMYISYVSDVGKLSTQNEKPISGKNISGFKIGINPQSRYNTPNGVYVYPLKEAWELYADETTKKIKVPFGGDNPMLYLLKSNNELKMVDVSNYNDDNLNDDYMKLAKIIINFIENKKKKSEAYGWEVAKAILDQAMNTSKNKSSGGQFWNMTRWTFFLLYNTGIIGYNSRQNYKDEISTMSKDDSMKADFKDDTIRMESYLMKRNVETDSSTKWSKIFLDLGYGGVSDKKGKGIIHEGEPYQGVFFSPKAYTVVGSFYNKSYYDYGERKGLIPVQFGDNKILEYVNLRSADLFKTILIMVGIKPNMYINFERLMLLIMTEHWSVWTAYLKMDGELKKVISSFNDLMTDGKTKTDKKLKLDLINKDNNKMTTITDDGIIFYNKLKERYIFKWENLDSKEEIEKIKKWISKSKD